MERAERAEEDIPVATVADLGKYRLIAELARGGMGIVYLAVVTGPGGFHKLYVLKELKPGLSDDPQFFAMFLDEARLSARLNHPNIVQTHEVGHAEGRHFLAMEYLEGQTLHRLLGRSVKLGRKLALEHHLRVVSEMLSGLHYAHELADCDGRALEIVHRDVSPHNVFVTYEGNVKVLDFGIAKAMDQSHDTRTGTLKGKVSYMSPEQARGARVDRRADIFSAGVMLWEAATGQRMWKGYSDLAILHSLGVGRIQPAKEALSSVPDPLDQICRRALAVDPAARYATAIELQSDIEDFLALLGPPTTARELARVTSEGFAGDRKTIRRLIDEQMRALRTVSTSEHASLKLLDLGPSTGRPTPSGAYTVSESMALLTRSSVRETLPPSGSFQGGILERVTSIPPPVILPPAPNRLFPIATAVIAVLAVLTSTVLALRTREEARQPTAVGDSPVAMPVPLPLATSALPTSIPKRSTLTVRASPAQAVILVDGKRAEENPHVVSVVEDDRDHLVRVEARGFVAKEKRVRFDEDVSLSVSLESAFIPSVQAPRAAMAKEGAPAPGPLPSATPEQTPRPARPKRDIDKDESVREATMNFNRRLALPAFALFVLLTPLAAHAEGADATDARVEDARTHFLRGVKLYEESDSRAALIEFERAYALAPNWSVLYNIGQTHYQLQEYAGALSSFEKYLREGGSEVPVGRKIQVEREIVELRGRVARVTIQTGVAGADVFVDDILVGKTPLPDPIPIGAGRRRITVAREGRSSASKLVNLAGGDALTVSFDLRESPAAAPRTRVVTVPGAPSAPSRTPAVVAWVGVSALAVGTGILAVLSSAASSDLSSLRDTSGASRAELDAAHSKTRTLALVTDILGASTLLAGGLAIYLTVATSARTQSTTARIGVGGSGVFVAGQF